MEKFTGKVWVLGDDIDTDIIIPTEYLALKTIDDMKQYGFSPLRPELAGQIQKGDIIVAGKNFGCGSSLPERTSAAALPENRRRRSSKRWESSVSSRNLLPEFSSETLSTTVFF